MNSIAANVAWVTAVLTCISAGVYLVVTEHYGWAWIPFLIALSIRIDIVKGDDEEKESPKS